VGIIKLFKERTHPTQRRTTFTDLFRISSAFRENVALAKLGSADKSEFWSGCHFRRSGASPRQSHDWPAVQSDVAGYHRGHKRRAA
jgi:hypothetical protein